MIKQDYLLRLIQEVMRAISMILHGKKNEEEKQKELDKCYQTFLGKDKTFFLSKNLEELTHTFSEEPEANQMMKLPTMRLIPTMGQLMILMDKVLDHYLQATEKLKQEMMI